MTRLHMLLLAGLFAFGLALAGCAGEAEQPSANGEGAGTESHEGHDHGDGEHDEADGNGAATTQPAASAGDDAAVILVNDVCPMSNHPVDKNVTVEIDGKTYGLCCEDCVQPFKDQMAAKANP